MTHKPGIFAVFALILLLLTLAACDSAPEAASAVATSADSLLLPMDGEQDPSMPCVECVQATLSANLTQEQYSKDVQAAVELAQANALATLSAVGATVSAAQTQEQNNADLAAARVAATAQIDRANAQATLVAAGSTQSAAQTQDAIRQTQVGFALQMTSDRSTQIANATLTQQYNLAIAAGTQTAVVEHSATQTQAAMAISQAIANQARQRRERDWNQLTFVGMWCLLISIPVSIGLGLGIFLRWTKNRIPPRRFDEPAAPLIIDHEPRPENQFANNQYSTGKSTDHVEQWLDEVKHKVVTNKKDDYDTPEN